MSLADRTDLTEVFVDPDAYADEERFHAASRVLRRGHGGVPERSATVFVGGLEHLPVSYRVS